MKKIISLLLVLVLVFAMAPAAHADDDSFDLEDLAILILRYYGCPDAGEGIFLDSGHLVSCSGKDCQCLAVLVGALEEEIAAMKDQELQVWIRTSRDADDQRHDTVVAELERPYNNKKITENEEYLESKEAVAKLFAEFEDESDMALMLYRPSEFTHNQTVSSCEYVVNELGGQLHVEYLLTSNGVDAFYGHGIGLVEEGSDKGAAESYIISRDPIEGEHPEHDLSVRMGKLLITLPDSCTEKAFSIGLSYYENGAVRVMLVDDAGKPIPGAIISTPLVDGASKAVTVNDAGKFEAIKDCASEGGLVVFAAPTGDDVFALSK